MSLWAIGMKKDEWNNWFTIICRTRRPRLDKVWACELNSVVPALAATYLSLGFSRAPKDISVLAVDCSTANLPPFLSATATIWWLAVAHTLVPCVSSRIKMEGSSSKNQLTAVRFFWWPYHTRKSLNDCVGCPLIFDITTPKNIVWFPL